MKIRHLLAAATLLLAVAGSASAQDIDLPDKGTTEWSISGDIRFESDATWFASARWVPFASPNLQWGVDLTVLDGPDIDTSGTIGGLVNWYFRSPNETNVLPYLGAGIAGTFGDLSGSVWDIHGGLKYFISSDVAIFGEIAWENFSDDAVDDTTGLTFGISVFR
jgi:opacity protein-like surface antigen